MENFEPAVLPVNWGMGSAAVHDWLNLMLLVSFRC